MNGYAGQLRRRVGAVAVGVVLLGTVAGCAQQQTGSAEAVGGADGSAEPSAATSAPSASPTESGEGDDGRTVIRDLPLPISIEVPDGWREIDPERAGVPNVALLLQYEPMMTEDHVPNVNVMGQLVDAETSLEEVADAEVEGAERAGYNPELQNRDKRTLDGIESMVQELRSDLEVDGSTLELAQVQTILAVPGSDARAGQKAVILFSGTVIVDRAEEVVPDIEAIVASARPAEN